MNKSLSRALLAAGVLAFAAAAQAGPMTGSGETGMTSTIRGDGQDHSYAMPSTNTMGAGPDRSSSTTYYAYPRTHLWPERRDSATATFNTPGRAGEASTMTNGVPNLETHNYSAPVSSVVIVPYTTTND
ncbi:MAG: hypothetical protein JWP41_4171 [Ramlibacter sp.]|nr:hypothetical protein [Ramlibacter sp.]